MKPGDIVYHVREWGIRAVRLTRVSDDSVDFWAPSTLSRRAVVHVADRCNIRVTPQAARRLLAKRHAAAVAALQKINLATIEIVDCTKARARAK